MQRKVAYFLSASLLLTACASGGDVPGDDEDQTTNDNGDVKDPVDPSHVRAAKEPILRDPEVVQWSAHEWSTNHRTS